VKLVLTGATGYAGGEVLRQALDDPEVERVTVVGRRALGRAHQKLLEIVLGDFLDYSLAAATALRAAQPGLRFCFVSGRGADPGEKAGALHRDIKGCAERRLFELGREIYTFRPAYIRPTRATGPRRDVARFLAPTGSLLAWWDEDLAVDCDRLAACLLDVAKHGAGERVLENRAIRTWPDAGGRPR
jgi:uncharacterized protein YbjT (DUF2867 family)